MTTDQRRASLRMRTYHSPPSVPVRRPDMTSPRQTEPTTYYADHSITVHHGDCIDVLRTLSDGSVHAVVTDPPYGIRFMGQAWDGADIEARTARGRETTPMPAGVARPRGGYRSAATEAGRYDLRPTANQAFQTWCTEWAIECLRVLKPGGHLLSFGGSRTWHRLTAAVEDAGFEIRDSIAWLYGSGFPKSLDVSRAIDRSAGVDREVVGSKLGLPGYHLSGRGTPGPAYGDSRQKLTTAHRLAASEVTAPATAEAQQWEGWGTALKPAFEPIVVGRKPLVGTVAANVITHGTGALNIAANKVGQQLRTNNAGGSSSLQRVSRVEAGYRDAVTESVGEQTTTVGRWPTNVLLDGDQATALDDQTGVLTSGLMKAGTVRADRDPDVYGRFTGSAAVADTPGDSGGASRFFPVFRYEAKAPATERPRIGGVAHPTVKPLALMRWLVRLITPPGGTVLEPFAGSGTTVEACLIEGFSCIAIERSDEYLPLIKSRIDRHRNPAAYLAANGDDLGLFGEVS